MTTLQKTPAGEARTGAKSGAAAAPLFRFHVVAAVFRRNLLGYLSNPAGYVFITLFVLVSSVVAFIQPEFFTNNLSNLAILNAKMPYLLLFFIPAVTMNTWAEERRQGTDELLFTLPARDIEIVLGKYFASLAIYTIALVFSLSHVVILYSLGAPDLGVMFTTYLGYWLMGMFLIAVGMFASLLSSNATVAFILGALFSCVPVFLWVAGSTASARIRRPIENLSVPTQFEDFGNGLIPMAGVFYFLSLTVGFLYVNMVLLGRRHWAGGERSKNLWVHSLVRVACVILALASLNVLISRSNGRLDLTAERVHSLSKETVALLQKIPSDRPVYIQAYISPQVPREYVEVKSDLVNLLKSYAEKGGDKIHLNLVETELFSNEARDAEKRFGIEPKKVPTQEDARQFVSEFFLGVAFSSGLEEVVIPFFDRGLPVEYELTRSIQVVSRTGRKKVGVLNTDSKLMGGFDMRTFGQTPEWSIVTELKKQYEVTSVSPDNEFPSDIDVLLVAQPSSLTQKQIENLTAYVRRGGPSLVFLDPLPTDNLQNAPEMPRQPPGGPFGGGAPPEPKGDLRPFLDLIGIDWPQAQIVWNPYNPLRRRPDLPPEIVFVSPGSGAEDAFNPKEAATAGLQQVVTLFGGLLREKSGGALDMIPLLRTSADGGTIAWQDMVQPGMMGGAQVVPSNNLRHFTSGVAYTVAARMQGTPAAPDDKSKSADEAKDKATEKDKPKEAEKPKPAEIHVIAVADLDIIGEQFFAMRREKIEELDFDNVTFVLNCVDVLARDESFIPLRKRRLKHRTLKGLEDQTRQFVEQSQKETKAAESAAEDSLKLAQQQLDKAVEDIKNSKDSDERTKEIQLMTLEGVANRRLEVQKAGIENEKRRKILESKAEMEQNIRSKENNVRAQAMILPPLPALILGLVVFGIRYSKENQGANPNRLA